MALLDYLGIAESYPLEKNPATGGFKTVRGQKLAEQDIYVVLHTPEGSVLGLENFGSKLYKLTHEPNDAVLKGLLVYHSSVALSKWAKKIDVVSVEVYMDMESATIRIRYRIKPNNETFTYDYEFKRQ